MTDKKQMIVIMGGPGTGKGTFSRMLHDIRPGYTHIETGAILRAQPENSPIRRIIADGNLIPDTMVSNIIAQQINNTKGDIILDGFPRTLGQAQWLINNFATRYDIHIIYLNVPDSIMVQRINKRKAAGSNRKDDNSITTIQHRIETFHITTMPAIEWLATRAGDITFSDVDSSEEESANFTRILHALKWK